MIRTCVKLLVSLYVLLHSFDKLNNDLFKISSEKKILVPIIPIRFVVLVLLSAGMLPTTRQSTNNFSYGVAFPSITGLEEDSSPEDDSTLKPASTWQNDSSSDASSSSSGPARSSTRCDDDFQWIRKEVKMEDVSAKPPIGRSKKPAPGSLDRRRHQRQERDQKSRSTHVPKSPPRLDDFAPCTNWCCSENYFENFHRRHERIDPQRYGSSPMLMDRGSHPDLYGCRHEMMGCCGYHVPPPCCFYGDRGYRWTPPPAPFPKVFDEEV